MKKTSKILLTVIVVVLLGIGVSTFFKVNGSIGNDKIQLRLAHGQAGDSEIGGTIAYLSDLVAEDESMNMEVSIYPSGVLGSETAMVELVQAGVLDMAKISANTLGQFDDRYTIFSLPYLFKGQEHYYNAMANSQVIRKDGRTPGPQSPACPEHKSPVFGCCRHPPAKRFVPWSAPLPWI